MNERPVTVVLQRLHPQVRALAGRGFSLVDDLHDEVRVHEAEAWSATVLCAARILEVLARQALEFLGLRPSKNVLSNLDTLYGLDLLPQSDTYWAHGLRRLGNDARHVERGLVHDDADLALVFLERWLRWFFVKYERGPCVESLTVDGGPLGLAPDREVARVAEQFDAPDFDPQALAERFVSGKDKELFTTATIGALLAEMLLDRKQHALAGTVLEAALRAFPRDPRLRQLAGIRCKRTEDWPGALKWLKPLYKDNSNDTETIGPLAAVYKEQWHANQADRKLLHKSHELYRKGWSEKSKEPYLGINAAATALFLGRKSDAQQLATEVRDLLRERARKLEKRNLKLRGYWNLVTLAEAELILSHSEEAERIYADAFRTYPKLGGDHKVTRKQAERVAPRLVIELSWTKSSGTA